jgi:hypothetical protein
MRVRPTHYIIRSGYFKSWVIESALDGETGTGIDRKTNNKLFKAGWRLASFPFLDSAECRFIRLTQTGKRHNGDDSLIISALEFFGTLLELCE